MEEDFYTSLAEDDPYGPIPIPQEGEPREEKTYTVILADGTELAGLKLNGNNFVSEVPVEKGRFDYNLSPVTISDGTVSERHESMELNALQVVDGKWYFVLLDISPQELWQRKVDADVLYLSMMTGAEID